MFSIVKNFSSLTKVKYGNESSLHFWEKNVLSKTFKTKFYIVTNFDFALNSISEKHTVNLEVLCHNEFASFTSWT